MVKAAKYEIQKREILDTKTLNLSCNIVLLQVLGRCFTFFTFHDQLVAQQKHLLQVEEMQRADWLICLVWIQDGGITTAKVHCCSRLAGFTRRRRTKK